MSFTLGESALEFIFFTMWNAETEEWWKANFSELQDTLPEDLKSVDPAHIVDTLRKHLFKSLSKKQCGNK